MNVGAGGLASYGRTLLADSDPTAALAALLPEPVDHVLLQADLTAVAPGPLESQLARKLQLVADVESRGGATVYRFTPTSVRRALDSVVATGGRVPGAPAGCACNRRAPWERCQPLCDGSVAVSLTCSASPSGAVRSCWRAGR